jgi:hypothetical protein
MKPTKNVILSLLILVVACSVYRAIPGRPYGVAPQWAMAIFGGMVFAKDKKWAFILPLLSMFLSDLLYEVLYRNGLSVIPGFYGGQWLNYLLFTSLACIGFFFKKINVANVLVASLAAPTVFFLISNFLVWAGHGGYNRPVTWQGLLWSYSDGLPFYVKSLWSTVLFSAVLFGTYFLAISPRDRARLA